MAERHDSTYKRIGIIMAMMLIGCIMVIGKSLKLKLVDGDRYSHQVDSIYKPNVKISATRGDILARDGRILACSLPKYIVTMDPSADGLTDKLFYDSIGTLSAQLSGMFPERSAGDYKAMLVNARKNPHGAGHRNVKLSTRQVTHTELKRLKTFAIVNRRQSVGGLKSEKRNHRTMPFGILCQRTIGRLTDEKTNMSGIELAYDSILSGHDGHGVRIRTAGRWVTMPEEKEEDGLDVVTTIDIDIQDVAESSLMNQLRRHDADHGVALLMEVKTGAIRAIVNLHKAADGDYIEDYNYAIGERAEPGSTFKLATMMACLEDGLVKATDTIDTYDGEYRIYDRVMRDSHQGGNGNVTLQRAFEVSSNIAFARLAMRCYGNDKGRYVKRLHDLGICDDLGIDLRGCVSTHVKEPSDPSWSGTTLPWMSIGYEVQLTPLQLLTFYNAVANGGTMMRPMFVERLQKQGQTVKEYHPYVMRNSIATRKTIKTVKEMLKGVVENGTAANIRDTPYKIAGKTGTAQIAGKGGYQAARQYLASFAGYFPADDPLYTCVVMVYGPSNNVYYGNVVAGSVVKAIADRVYAAEFRKGSGKTEAIVRTSETMPRCKGGSATDLMAVLTDLKLPHTAMPTSAEWVSTHAKGEAIAIARKSYAPGEIPNVIGLGASDAVSVIEKMGYRVRMSGTGRVGQQTPLGGTAAPAGTVVTLEMRN